MNFPDKTSKLKQDHRDKAWEGQKGLLDTNNYMAGNKRAWDGNVIASPLETENMDTSPGASSIQSIFTEFRNELDEHHDRRERVVKASRDITALSKKM